VGDSLRSWPPQWGGQESSPPSGGPRLGQPLTGYTPCVYVPFTQSWFHPSRPSGWISIRPPERSSLQIPMAVQPAGSLTGDQVAPKHPTLDP
jgi:hypothetical protein